MRFVYLEPRSTECHCALVAIQADAKATSLRSPAHSHIRAIVTHCGTLDPCAYIARTAKQIVAGVDLARGPVLDAVAARLVQMGICRRHEPAVVSLGGLKRRLEPRQDTLNNLYLHVTLVLSLVARTVIRSAVYAKCVTSAVPAGLGATGPGSPTTDCDGVRRRAGKLLDGANEFLATDQSSEMSTC